MSDPAVSIVLPVRNGAAELPALFDAIGRQRVDFSFEIVAIDSGSDDGTAALLRDRADRFVAIAAGDFDHGLTRNLGIEHARGELIVLIVHDALPASDGWLAALTAPLFADARVAGAFARQVPRPDASPLARRSLAWWVAASEMPRTIAIESREAFDKLDPMARMRHCAFDNVCSCIRRSVWAEHPFRATPIGEDIAWAKEVLLAGYRLEYVPSATVIHSHDKSVWYEFTRTRLLHGRLYDLFGLQTIPTLPLLAGAIASTLVSHLRCQRNARAIALAFAWPLAQYLGARSAIRGRSSGSVGSGGSGLPAEARSAKVGGAARP